MGFNPFKIDKKLGSKLVQNSAALRNTQAAKSLGLTKPKPAAKPIMTTGGNTPALQDPGVRRGIKGQSAGPRRPGMGLGPNRQMPLLSEGGSVKPGSKTKVKK